MQEDSAILNILVVGGGAIGKLLAASLSAPDGESEWNVRVTLKAGGNAAELRRSGVILRLAGISRTARPAVATDYSELDPSVPWIVMLAVKAYSLDGCLEELKKANLKIRCIFSPLNGLGIEEKVAQHFPDVEIIAGSITLPVDPEGPNTAKVTNMKGGIALAPFRRGVAGLAETLASLFRKAGFETAICDNSASMKWSKLLLNIIANATSAILDMTASELFKDPTGSHIEREMLREYFAVARKAGVSFVDLPGYPAKKLKLIRTLTLPPMPMFCFRSVFGKSVEKSRGNKLASFHNDLRILGRSRTEVEFLNGAIASAGSAVGLRCPYNAGLSEILTAVAAEYPGNPYRGNSTGLAKMLSVKEGL
jgi:2-dehydropantoate 2-reductase